MKLTDTKFSDFGLHPDLQKGLDECGFTNLSEVQERSIPEILKGKDLGVQAQTGSGKTIAFLVPIMNHMLTKERVATRGVCPRAIVIAPTRELAVQVARDAEAIGKHVGLRVLLAYGGVDYKKQRDEIKDGVDLLVGTPGRLIDYLKQQVYHLKDVEFAVIDEADRMFDMGFIADIRFLLRRMSPYDKRQSLLFSATLGDRVMELSYEYMNLPELVAVTPDKVVADKVEQVLYHLGSGEKPGFLIGMLRSVEWTKALVFVNTKRQANNLCDLLNHNNIPTAILSGDVSQDKRLKVLRHYMHGELRVLVATDVASRGLHIDGVSHVINYDLPQEAEDYVHRIGRTARAGATGKAVSLACEDYVFSLPEIEAYIGHPVPTASVPEEWIIEPDMPPRKKHPHPPHGRGGRPHGGGQRSGGRRGGPGGGGAGNRRRSGGRSR